MVEEDPFSGCGAGEAAAFGNKTREAGDPIGEEAMVHTHELDPSRLFLLSTGEWDSGEVRLNFMVILGRSSGEIGALAPGDGSFLGEVGANTPVHTTFDGDCADGRGCGCCGCGCCRF